MAISTIASCTLHTKLPNLSFASSPLPPLYTHFTSKSAKPLKLAIRVPFSRLILPHFHCSFSAIDSFEPTHDEEVSDEDDTGGETQDYYDVDDSKPPEPSEEAKLYVGNFPFSMTAEQLREVFEEAGRVVNVEVVYDRVTDRSRGFGFVRMGSVDEAKQAIKMFNGSQVEGRTLRVNFPDVPKGGEREVMAPKIRSTHKGFIDSPHQIYAGNLGWGVTSQGLREAFADQPGLLGAKVIYERGARRSRGFGFVSFESAEDAEAALNAKNGVEVEGRPLRLNMAADRARPPPAPQSDTDNESESSESNELLSSISG